MMKTRHLYFRRTIFSNRVIRLRGDNTFEISVNHKRAKAEELQW